MANLQNFSFLLLFLHFVSAVVGAGEREREREREMSYVLILAFFQVYKEILSCILPF